VQEDAVALDIYPNPGADDSRLGAALAFDLTRSLRGQSWILMEQAASAVSHQCRLPLALQGHL
jgi:beta-galactosidase